MSVRSLVLILLLAGMFAPVPYSAAEDGDAGGRLRVQLVAVQQTSLSSEIAAKIDRLPLREGDAFKQGDLLAGFDCSLMQAQLNKAEATAEAARSTLKVNRRLAGLDAISTLEVEQAEAKLKETEAEVAAMRVTVSKCSLLAPFSGRVARMYVDPHQFLQPGKQMMDILDTNSLEVRLIAPSRMLSWLRVGGRFTVRIEELGRSYTARVIRIGAKIDPLSQSVPVIGEIEGSHAELLPGMSGWAGFTRVRR
ncbi:MAG: efflux RND transporter periplasmic adaptor subunit [Deltaproteobacteria bacterium]|nr:efflux RND transporter periplasmic adaptor subunit [Deltaproteobacteria bacterium]